VRPVVLAVLGPTASGKSALGLALAERRRQVLADSMCPRGFIGTVASPSSRGIPHHLIALMDPQVWPRNLLTPHA
jgi:tRNA A37 N6-isopentenylltransferase MiaA